MVRIVRTRTDGPSLNGALARTGHAAARVLRAAVRRAAGLLTCRASTCAPCGSPLRAPLRAAWGELRERELLGCALRGPPRTSARARRRRSSPTTACPSRAVAAALDAYAAVLAAAPDDAATPTCSPPARPSATCPQALAGVDLALWDRAGRRAGRPVAALLAALAVRDAIAVNATLGAEDRAGAAAQAPRRARRGLPLRQGQGRASATTPVAWPRSARRSGRESPIRVDANGAWGSPDEALANLRALAPAGLELAEEPVHGVEALRAVRAASPMPVAMDETAAEPGAVGSGAADAVCLKVARCGGISGLLRDAAAARAAGSRSTSPPPSTGRCGVAAGVHAAAALVAAGPEPLPCGLATLGAFVGFEDVLRPVDGAIAVPTGPGLLG